MHSKVKEYCASVVQKPMTALVAAKEAIKQAENLSMKDGIALERNLFYPLFDTEGVKEGVSAFV